MRRTLLLILLLLVVPAHAERVWVLGSFSEKENALRMMERLSIELGVEVLVVPYVKRGTHRVVIRETEINDDRLVEKNLEAWLANIELPAMRASDPQPVEPARPEREAEPDPVVILMDEPEPEGIAPDETIEAYCERMPSDCDADSLGRLQERREHFDAKRQQLEEDCRSVHSQEEKEICNAWRAGDDLDGFGRR